MSCFWRRTTLYGQPSTQIWTFMKLNHRHISVSSDDLIIDWSDKMSDRCKGFKVAAMSNFPILLLRQYFIWVGGKLYIECQSFVLGCDILWHQRFNVLTKTEPDPNVYIATFTLKNIPALLLKKNSSQELRQIKKYSQWKIGKYEKYSN